MDGTQFARDLREVADFYDTHPDFPQPDKTWHTFVFDNSKEELARAARALGKCQKRVDEQWYELSRQFGSIKLTVNAYRDKVCERVQTGTKVVPEQHLEAKPAETIPEHEEPIYEWKCPEAILSSKEGI